MTRGTERRAANDQARGLVVGIDASRNRSGGAQAHLAGILSSVDPSRHGIAEVHVWAFKDLLDLLPDRPWLIKHNPEALERSLLRQLWWQAVHLATEADRAGCNILFTTDASTLCRFRPSVVLSQDLLSYDPAAMKRVRPGFARLRLLAILYVQNAAFRRAAGVIFLTRHAGDQVERSCGKLRNSTVIPHGVAPAFAAAEAGGTWPPAGSPIRCLYVSPVFEYKHQWVVVEAVARLRARGRNVELTLVGGGEGPPQQRLEMQIRRSTADAFVRQMGAVRFDEMPGFMAAADIFVFASSCEAFGITLLEAMSVGLPIACSERSSLPETLADGGVYFDPESAESIADAIERIIVDATLRGRIRHRARELSRHYSWGRCADETFGFVSATAFSENYA